MNITAENLLAILLMAPLVSAVLSAAFFRKSRWGAPILSCLAAGVILAASLQLLFTLDFPEPLKIVHDAAGENGFSAHALLDPAVPFQISYSWLELGSFKLNIGFLLDATAATMLFVVAFVGFWIHIFSIGYMNDDPARGRFFAGLSVFMFSILGIVVADNLYMIFIFWELVGFSSYMLIAHYFDRKDAAEASKKAFITNRIGDLGFLVGIILCQVHYGTVSLVELNATGEKMTLIGFLLMCGFLGKSAQFPLHVWLTDAMAGPTPVSALIHAATMVAAGVYFMVRIFFLFTAPVLTTMLWLCAGMAALAGLCALAQTDIKKSLAYSTLSHLGFMGAAIGLGLPEMALLHMTTHAFFKATLFLCAGSVIHACHHEQEMPMMGGLWKKMPVTFFTFALAAASLCAFPFFAGWYSKDTILASSFLQKNYGAFALLAIAALGSALYCGRMLQLVFLGKPNSEKAAHAHESNAWMTTPLLVLGAIFSVSAGIGLQGENWLWLNQKMSGILPAASLQNLAPAYHELHHNIGEAGLFYPFLALGILIIIAGFGGAILFYKKTPADDALRVKFPKIYGALNYRWMDTLYEKCIEKIQKPLANTLGFLDAFLINGVAVRGVFGGIPAILGLASQRFFHTGNLHNYVFWFALGALLYGGVLLVNWANIFCCAQ